MLSIFPKDVINVVEEYTAPDPEFIVVLDKALWIQGGPLLYGVFDDTKKCLDSVRSSSFLYQGMYHPYSRAIDYDIDYVMFFEAHLGRSTPPYNTSLFDLDEGEAVRPDRAKEVYRAQGEFEGILSEQKLENAPYDWKEVYLSFQFDEDNDIVYESGYYHFHGQDEEAYYKAPINEWLEFTYPDPHMLPTSQYNSSVAAVEEQSSS
jgi:hypothetical protein